MINIQQWRRRLSRGEGVVLNSLLELSDWAGKLHEYENQNEYSAAGKEAYRTCQLLFSAGCSALVDMKLIILLVAS